MYEAFLRSDYYGPPPHPWPWVGNGPAHHPGVTVRWEGDRGMVPTFTS